MRAWACWMVAVAGCQSGGDGSQDATTATAEGTETTPTSASTAPTSTATETNESGGSTGGAKFDVAVESTSTTGAPPPSCKVVDDMDAVGECEESAPPNSFEPDTQWEWWGEGPDVQSVVTPLVANLTDDNGDDEIDLCDVPDVIVIAGPTVFTPGHLYMLDGETGMVELQFGPELNNTNTPAIADIDNDGIAEIIASTSLGAQIIAFEHDGTQKWMGNTPWTTSGISALAVADMDNDGNPEIIAGSQVYDNNGNQKWAAPNQFGSFGTSTAADLNDDGTLELVLGNEAYTHDGVLLWAAAIQGGFPQIGNLDGDPNPEILVTNSQGISVLEHDGTVKFSNLTPTGDPASGLTWQRPATIHDFDGDSVAEFALSSANHYTVYEADGTIVWTADVADLSGIAGGTAFDFLGDGDADAMYADEHTMFIYGGMGQVLLQFPRLSRTGTEYPTVADIDNDGSAEILVVSNECIDACGLPPSPTVQAIRDIQDRWIQPRRIWNQHTYHVTNVREDGTIPQFETPNWEILNTFRTNAQIEGGGLCKPPPEG